MEIRGLENIATEIIKREREIMRYTVLIEEVVRNLPWRRRLQKRHCVWQKINMAKGKLCWNREIWKMYR